MSYWEIVRPTYIENWPNALHSLSFASIDVPLTRDEAIAIGANMYDWGEAFQERYPRPTVEYDTTDIRRRVSEAVDNLPNGAFIRLGSRSPKDSWDGHRIGFKTEHGDDPLRFILDASERMYEDILLALQNDYAPHIFVRSWQDIPKWAEFRCFMRDRKLVGISQYNYLDNEQFEEIKQYAGTIEWVLGNFFVPFKQACHLDDVVFDVFLKTWTNRDKSRMWEVRLLEINPAFEYTDPCLFSWARGGDFDGSFRYNGKPS